MKIYKIRNKEGKYSTGGFKPRWSREGRVWTKRSLHLYLNMLKKEVYSSNISWTEFYKDCELVELSETKSESINPILFAIAV